MLNWSANMANGPKSASDMSMLLVNTNIRKSAGSASRTAVNSGTVVIAGGAPVRGVDERMQVLRRGGDQDQVPDARRRHPFVIGGRRWGVENLGAFVGRLLGLLLEDRLPDARPRRVRRAGFQRQGEPLRPDRGRLGLRRRRLHPAKHRFQIGGAHRLFGESLEHGRADHDADLATKERVEREIFTGLVAQLAKVYLKCPGG